MKNKRIVAELSVAEQSLVFGAAICECFVGFQRIGNGKELSTEAACRAHCCPSYVTFEVHAYGFSDKDGYFKKSCRNDNVKIPAGSSYVDISQTDSGVKLDLSLLGY